jgi:hypothetical protein
MTVGVSLYLVSVDLQGQVIGSVLLPDISGVFDISVEMRSTDFYLGLEIPPPDVKRSTAEELLVAKSLDDQMLFEPDISSLETEKIMFVMTKFGYSMVHPNLTVGRRLSSAVKITVSKKQFTTVNSTHRPEVVLRGVKVRPALLGNLAHDPGLWPVTEGISDEIITSMYALTQPFDHMIKAKMITMMIYHAFWPALYANGDVGRALLEVHRSMDPLVWQWAVPLMQEYVISALSYAGRAVPQDPLPDDRDDLPHWVRFTLEGKRCYYGHCTHSVCQNYNGISAELIWATRPRPEVAPDLERIPAGPEDITEGEVWVSPEEEKMDVDH